MENTAWRSQSYDCSAKQIVFDGNLRDYEYSFYESDRFVTFNLVEINTDKKEITVAISSEGRISVCTFELKIGELGLYFEYGIMCDKIAVVDFERIEEN